MSPLTWSHATVMIATIKYLVKHSQLTGRSTGAFAERAFTRPR